MHPDNLCVSEWKLLEDNRLFCWLGWCSSCSGKRQSQAETAGIDCSVGLVGAAETAAPPTVSVRRPIGFRSLHDDRSIESGRNFLCLFFTDF